MTSPDAGGTSSSNRAEVFKKIVETNYWQGSESVSGTGSDMTQTRVLRRELPAMLQRLGVRTLLDAPCGDFAWMRTVELPVERYIGADIVAELASRVQAEFGNAQRSFMQADLVVDRLPQVDAIFCRDCLVHLPFADIEKAVENFRASGATWLLTTTFPTRPTNRDVALGRWRPLNLQVAPFHWPAPTELLNEECTENGGKYADKSLAAWRLSDIPRAGSGSSFVARLSRGLKRILPG